MEKKGRPPNSPVRANIIEMLFFMGAAHGYEIAKHYNNIFPKATQRVVYYNLKKGVEYSLFVVKEIKKVGLGYSWGAHAEQIVYELTNKAKPKVLNNVKEYFDKLNKDKKKENKQ